MFFCDLCDNILNISKSQFRVQSGGSVQSILDKSITDEQLLQLDIKKVVASAEYKKLNKEDKDYVLNRLKDASSTKDVLKQETKQDLEAFFICDNCGFTKRIKNGTKIFSKTSYGTSSASVSNDEDYKSMLNSNILQHTRKYICPNEKCPSHKDPTKKEAVFFRLANSYKMVYVCKTCETPF